MKEKLINAWNEIRVLFIGAAVLAVLLIELLTWLWRRK
jgi:hypothetical protein